MSNLSVGGVLNNMKNPAILGGGIMLGIVIQKLINKLLSTETVVNGLGSDTVVNLKDFASPLLTSVIGVGVSMTCNDDLVRKLASGVAISGPLNVAMKLAWDKNLLAGLNGGALGAVLGGDDDLDDIAGYEDVDIAGLGDLDDLEEQPMALTTGSLDIPFTPPALRDTNYERETVSGFGYAGIL